MAHGVLDAKTWGWDPKNTISNWSRDQCLDPLLFLVKEKQEILVFQKENQNQVDMVWVD